MKTIQKQTNIVEVIKKYIQLKQENGYLVGECPFCKSSDKIMPSLFVNPNKDYFCCFDCDVHGDAKKFEQKIKKLKDKGKL